MKRFDELVGYAQFILLLLAFPYKKGQSAFRVSEDRVNKWLIDCKPPCVEIV